MKYEDFKKTTAYNKVFGASEVAYIIGLTDNTGFKPIGRGGGFNIDARFGQTPVEEMGVELIREHVDEKYTISGSMDSFFIPAQGDMLPTTQNFRDKEYFIKQVVAGGVAAKALVDYAYTDANGVKHDIKSGTVIDLEGTILQGWSGVKFTGEGIRQGANGIIGNNISFVAQRKFSGDEIAAGIDTNSLF